MLGPVLFGEDSSPLGWLVENGFAPALAVVGTVYGARHGAMRAFQLEEKRTLRRERESQLTALLYAQFCITENIDYFARFSRSADLEKFRASDRRWRELIPGPLDDHPIAPDFKELAFLSLASAEVLQQIRAAENTNVNSRAAVKEHEVARTRWARRPRPRERSSDETEREARDAEDAAREAAQAELSLRVATDSLYESIDVALDILPVVFDEVAAYIDEEFGKGTALVRIPGPDLQEIERAKAKAGPAET